MLSAGNDRDRGSVRRAAWAVAALALLFRLPFAARRLWDHDSVQFALGVERFDLAAHHPHPPGYPLYIGLLKALAWVGIEALDGMVALSVLAGALGAGLMVLLAARLARSPAAALFAGLLYATNPLLWFYGELPLVYAVEGGLAVAIAYGAVQSAESRRALFLTCALLALAGGLRQSTMVLLAPLVAYGAFRGWRAGRLSWKAIGGGAALAAALILAWLLPLWALAGGPAAYRRIAGEHFATLLPQTSVLYGAGWPALAHNLEVLLKWALQGVVPGAVALVALWAATPRAVAGGLRLLARRLDWLLAWALPPLAFFALFHVTKAGYTLVHLPALLVALALAAAPALAASRARAFAGTAAAAAVGLALFLFGSDRRPDQPRAWALVRHELNRGAIDRFERELDRVLEVARGYPPETTVLASVELPGRGAAGAEGFLYPWHRHLQWYLPEYQVVLIVPADDFALTARGHEPFQKALAQLALPPETRRLLFVLSEPPRNRLRLGPGFVAMGGDSFWIAEVPFRGRLQVGPFVLSAGERRARPHPPARRGSGA
ncbi:MAG TPA: DUF2723 domain-containing protein [Thermoanaerobaculia bacterium]|nr:DUF2723 domain-containing protein [Thermoanaerobaculia bacterium]